MLLLFKFRRTKLFRFFVIQFTPPNLKSCYSNSEIAIAFCSRVWSCIYHALYLVFAHDNVISLAVYATYFVGVWVDDWVWPCCYVALFVLEGSIAQKFVFATSFCPLSFLWPRVHFPIQVSKSSAFPAFPIKYSAIRIVEVDRFLRLLLGVVRSL